VFDLTFRMVFRFVFCICLGLELASGTVTAALPAPFTAVEATASSFEWLNRKARLGNFLLPDQIDAKGKPVLAAPIRLVSEPPECLACPSTSVHGRVIEHQKDSAAWEWTAESLDFLVSSHLTADCDGFSWYEIELKPKHPTSLSSLRLEIPRTKQSARYLHTSSYDWSNVSQGLPELGGRWNGPFTPYIWMGDEERGLAWCAESDEGWALVEPKKALSISTEGETVLFKVTFLDHQQTIEKPIKLRFGLQASPVKPVSFAWRRNARILHDIHYDSAQPGTNGLCELDVLRDGGVKTVVIHDSWTKYFGQMVPADDQAFRGLIEACHQRGLRLLVYVGYGLARTAPELQGKHDEWSVTPLIPWDPGYKPETRGFDATCSHSAWADWLVAGTDKLFAAYKLDGLYFDGTSEGWRCSNQAHGCGWKDSGGQVHTIFPILSARALMRRMADTVHRHNPQAILDVHMSSNLTLPTLSFCDSLWNGEQFESHTSAEKFQVPLHAFRTEFMGYAHGMDMEFLCYENRPFSFTEAIALAWVHGIEVRPYPKNLSYVTPIWRAMDHFKITEAKWQPYWEGSGASCDNADTQISSWVRKGSALLFISHLARNDAVVQVKLDREKLGLRPQANTARDALLGTELPVAKAGLELKFSGMNFRMIEVH
jgi:hypothetical protein